MASAADLREELSCSICLSLYRKPVSLRCGHSFCQECLVAVLDTQDGTGVYTCPECRETYLQRPHLENNRKLSNIVESFQSAHHQEKAAAFCTYCDLPEPAVKVCLQCEAAFCEHHLRKHTKSAEHVLLEPSASLEEDRRCSVHKEVLRYYCTEDKVSVCVSCCLAGRHRGHLVDSLDEASEKKKEKLKKLIEKLNSCSQDIDGKIQDLQTHRKQEKGKTAAVTQRVTGLFSDIRRKLDHLEWKLLCQIFKQEKQVLSSVSDLIQQLETQKDELSNKIHQMEALCQIVDPLMFLGQELSTKDCSPGSCEVIGDVREAASFTEAPISEMLHRGLLLLADSLTDLNIKRQFSVMEKSKISLDMDTAHVNIRISEDLRLATYAEMPEIRPDGPERFKSLQVLSRQSFSSGRHYWEVDVSHAKKWLIGVASHSIERKTRGKESYIGYNKKSWGLYENHFFRACHNNMHTTKGAKSSAQAIGIYLDYESGLLSFYQLCDPIRHLHTFTATFTEPLHAAFYVFPGSCIRIID
ncbi:E3 ubiquitin-protein ligase TRIM39-like [Hyperolius riggenbachi]|uniref:E3 ubiquitin-protein ligase TRIM39-like n=1 Tax=Hyperolius riggenbachi TaxID=752182 RepID=UPI0035A33DAF